MGKKTVTTALGVVAALAVAVPGTHAGTAHAAFICDGPQAPSYTDFDNDGKADAVVGVPGEDIGGAKDAGRVEVRYGNGKVQGLHLPKPKAGDRFGTAAIGFALGAGSMCGDLLVGVPGRDVGGRADAGAVAVFVGTPNGLSYAFTDTQYYDDDHEEHIPGDLRAGARLGATLATGPSTPVEGGTETTVYIGAPGTTVGGKKGAGAVARTTYRTSSDEAETTISGTLFTEGTHGVPGPAGAGDEFGASIAANGALIGAPGRTVNGRADAGAAYAAVTGGDTYRRVTQDSDGVPGTAEAGDRFGAAVLRPNGGERAYVGAPGESIGSLAGAGSVLSFDASGLGADGPVGVAIGYRQGTPDVVGTAEAGDHFGASLGQAFGSGTVAGAPGEDVGSVRDAGAVFALGPIKSEVRSWSQRTAGVPGTPEPGDRFGAVLGRRGAATLVGIPGENSGAGSTLVGLPGPDVLAPSVGWHQESGASESGDGFGAALTDTYN
ncbi:MAG TPA: hypothetical protein VF053_04215 [Streptosporangiales bacterium]